MALSRLRILVFPESPKAWTARSLEHDLAAGGRTAEAAIDTLLKIAQAHINFDTRHGHEPLSAFSAAPQIYWNAFGRSTAKPMQLVKSTSGTQLQYIVTTIAQNPALTKLPRRSQIA
jgi:hypothetical protein